MATLAPLIRLLADGCFHSGERIAEVLQVSRAAVWNRVQRLADVGLKVDAVRGKGYRLTAPLDLLDADEIARNANMDASLVRVFPELNSTNRWLHEQADLPTGQVCLAEYQLAGRGRSGRNWAASWGGGILFSMLWRMPMRGDLPSLSLVVGIAVAEQLRAIGVPDVQVKWPNDLVHRGRKLGGILIEVSGEAQGACQLVIGVGLNYRQGEVDAEIDQPWIDAQSLVQAELEPRSVLVSNMIVALQGALRSFEVDGFQPFMERWRALDWLAGKQVTISRGASGSGQALGIDRNGALLVETASGQRSFQCGEVSVRV